MNGDRAVAAAAALLCVFAFGTAATTLDSSLSSEPGDLIDPDYGGLPFEQEDVAELREEFQAAEEGGESQSSEPAAQGPTEPQREEDVGAGDPQSDQSSAPEGPDSTTGQRTTEPSLLDRLLSLWPLLVLLVVAALAYRYRGRLRALLAALVGGIGPATAGGRVAEPDPWADLDPSNDVERAWVTMVRAAGLSRPWTKTPGECADEAVSSGMDPDAVRTITDVFEEVRYGGARPTEGHERRAREGLRGLDVGRGTL